MLGRQINQTINIATSLADNMFNYAARIKGADVRIKNIGDRIRSTCSILSEIKVLFEQLTGPTAESPSELPVAGRQLYDELESCEASLNLIEKQISEVMNQIPPPSKEALQKREKVELAQETIVLLETRIAFVEMEIHDHKLNLQIRLSMFSMSILGQKEAASLPLILSRGE
jgi:chromosome segregation ATPase